jgi:hypothetical protein
MTVVMVVPVVGVVLVAVVVLVDWVATAFLLVQQAANKAAQEVVEQQVLLPAHQ